MKYSYTWLKELSGTKKAPRELAELLTMRAFELEDAKTEGKETQLEFSILPNRAHDALSHVGMAREICALEGRKFKNGDLISIMEIKFPNRRLKVEIKDKKLCPRYIGAVIGNIKVTASPKWIQERLVVCGIKPINNIVDITNYVMLETGQPLHAFDADKTTGNIIVRTAKKGEKIKLLDEKVYELNENNLVIADSQKALALAGVMGGFDSSITNKTTSIILESASFNSTSVRKARTSHNVITESSHRFERDIDPNLAEIAMARAIELLKKIGKNKVEVTAITDVYPKKVKSWQIKLDANYVNSLLGETILVAKIKNILENLGLGVKISKNILNCEIPTRRIDLKTQEDLIEEIGRIYGYENIKEQAPSAEIKSPAQNIKRNFENNLRDILAGLGFSEVMNYSFYSKDDIEKFRMRAEEHVEVENPLSSDQQYLRKSLLPGILKNIKLNLKNFPDCSIFEIGHMFRNIGENTPLEAPCIWCALADKGNKAGAFFELKGILENLLSSVGIQEIEFDLPSKNYLFHPTRVAEIKSGKARIGKIGEVHPEVSIAYGIKKRVSAFFLRIDELLKIANPERKFSPISKFPTVERDISMFVGKETKYSDIVLSIKKSGGNIMKNVELFDVFEKEGEKSLALRVEIGSDAKTMTSEEIDAVMKKIISTLEKDLKVKVRKQ